MKLPKKLRLKKMYELKKLTERCYYVDSPSKVGIVLLDSENVLLIDAGNDKDSAKKTLRIIDSMGWRVQKILATHSHADHVGGAAYIVKKTGAAVYAKGIEKAFIEYTVLEPTYVWGGDPHSGLCNKIFLAPPCNNVSDISEIDLPDGFEILELYGHSFDQVGLLTPDGVAFIADAVVTADVINKHGVSFTFDVGGFLDTLERLKTLKADTYFLTHGEPTDDLLPLIEFNIEKVDEVCGIILEKCKVPSSFEDILKCIFDAYSRHINEMQYSIIGSSLKGYLTYLRQLGKIEPIAQNNYLLWKIV